MNAIAAADFLALVDSWREDYVLWLLDDFPLCAAGFALDPG